METDFKNTTKDKNLWILFAIAFIFIIIGFYLSFSTGWAVALVWLIASVILVILIYAISKGTEDTLWVIYMFGLLLMIASLVFSIEPLNSTSKLGVGFLVLFGAIILLYMTFRFELSSFNKTVAIAYLLLWVLLILSCLTAGGLSG